MVGGAIGQRAQLAEMFVLRVLEDSARAGSRCPTPEEWLDLFLENGFDYSSLQTSVNHIQSLERKGIISVKRFQRSRQVTITATGESTMMPSNQTPHWRDRPKPEGVPTLAPEQLKARSPAIADQIFQEARRSGISPADYVAHLVWRGWNAEKVGQ